MEIPPVSNTAGANSLDGCATDQTVVECPKAREPNFVRIARQLEEDIRSRRMRDILHIGAIDCLQIWLAAQSPFASGEELITANAWGHEEEARAMGWKELIDLCLLAEIFNPDLEVKAIRVFRFKCHLETMPDGLMAYLYKRTTEESAFRKAVVEERIFKEELLQVGAVGRRISYSRAFLLDLVQGQTRYYSRRDYHDDDEEDFEKEYQDGVIVHFQLVHRLKQLRKILDLADSKYEDSEDEETDDEETEDEEMEDEEMEDEEMEDDTDYEEDNKGHELEVINQQAAERILRAIATLITMQERPS